MKLKKLRERKKHLDPKLNNVILNENKYLDKIYKNRGIKSKQELEHSLKNLLNYTDLINIKEACEILYCYKNKKILIIGDYDCDGATSTAILYNGLQELGIKANKLEYFIPNRIELGYGFSPKIAEIAKEKEIDLCITVDNGISSVEGVEKANQYNIKTIITDHHIAPKNKPKASAIINPNQKECKFKSKNIAGVGVAFYLLMGYRRFLIDKKKLSEAEKPNLSKYLDLVALGTLADQVILDYNNRILVTKGLEVINKSRNNLGLQCLLESACQKKNKDISSEDMIFSIAPKLNSIGRIEDMNLGVDLLVCKDKEQAKIIIEKITLINTKRKKIQQSMMQEAVKELYELKTKNKLVFYSKNWHQGIVGLIASRLVDEINYPVICLADDKEGNIKGSGRSIKGFNILEILRAIKEEKPELIAQLGGHSMAAGLTIKKSQQSAFMAYFEQKVLKQITTKKITYWDLDGTIKEQDLNLQNIKQISSQLWGAGFEAPSFFGEFEITRTSIVKEKHFKIVLKIDKNKEIIAWFFNVEKEFERIKKSVLEQKKIKIIYSLNVNFWQNKESQQLIIKDIVE